MSDRKENFEEIVELLNKVVWVLNSEGLNNSTADAEKLINQIKGMGSIIPSHKNGLCSIIRVMLESGTYYESKAGENLDKVLVLIQESLGESV